jgi:hypothetical protein
MALVSEELGQRGKLRRQATGLAASLDEGKAEPERLQTEISSR